MIGLFDNLIYDNIFSYINPDLNSLKASRLVCKEWQSQADKYYVKYVHCKYHKRHSGMAEFYLIEQLPDKITPQIDMEYMRKWIFVLHTHRFSDLEKERKRWQKAKKRKYAQLKRKRDRLRSAMDDGIYGLGRRPPPKEPSSSKKRKRTRYRLSDEEWSRKMLIMYDEQLAEEDVAEEEFLKVWTLLRKWFDGFRFLKGNLIRLTMHK